MKNQNLKKLNFYKVLIILFILNIPLISQALISFPTKIDTKQERINLQTVLNTVMTPSPNLKVDGVLGKKSIQAIQAFQESKGLVADGKPGPITRQTLEKAQGISTTTTNTITTNTTSGTVNTNAVCFPGALYNSLTGQKCDTKEITPKTEKTPSSVLVCTGSTTQPCNITNGTGTSSRTCTNGVWSSYGSCTLASCNTGYQINGNACVVIPAVTTPTLTNIQTSNIANTSATISWNVSPASTGRIEYGTTTSYGNLTILETEHLSFHSQNITGLSAGTLYHYRILGTSASGSSVASTDYTFTTTGSVVVVPPTPPVPPPATGLQTYYVATNGNDNNPGTLAQPWATWGKAFSTAVAGDTVYIRGGEYFPTTTFQTQALSRDGTPSNPIRILNYPGEKPILNGQNINLTGWNFAIYLENSDYWYIKGLELKNFREAPHPNIARGFVIRNGRNITFENCVAHDIGGDGFSVLDAVGEINIINSDAYNNADVNYGGESANGMWVSGTQSSVFNIIGNRAWNNSDDGIDFFYAEGVVNVDSSWAFDHNNPNAGDGNGFKLGAAYQPALSVPQRIIKNSIGANNKEIGFDQNEAHVRMEFFNNIAYGNRYGFILDHWNLPIILRNNISYNTGTNAFNSSAVQDHNSWNGGVTITDADFVSLDGSQLRRPRKSDGSLPDIDFLKIAQGSDLINAGVDVGIPYNGTSPDIGVFETNY